MDLSEIRDRGLLQRLHLSLGWYEGSVVYYSDGMLKVLNELIPDMASDTSLEIFSVIRARVVNGIAAWKSYKELFSNFSDPFIVIHEQFAYISDPSKATMYVLAEQEFHMLLRVIKERFNGDMSQVISMCELLCKKIISPGLIS